MTTKRDGNEEDGGNKETPEAEASKKQKAEAKAARWLKFRGHHHPRIGQDYQVTSLPDPKAPEPSKTSE